MATRREVGGFVHQYAVAAATIGVTPLLDRAGILKRLNLSNPSAIDTWTLTIGGRELARFRQLNVGNQQLLLPVSAIGGGVGGKTAPFFDFFTYCLDQLKIDAAFPIPNGLTATIASVGGATGDLDVEFLEVDAMDVSQPSMLNHYAGKDFLIPVAWALAASQTGNGPTQLDTQYGPSWLPALFSATPLPANWAVDILALFIEGLGVNTFSGAANHQSTTQDLRVVKNGTTLFSRTTTGIPVRGAASAAGSANTVFGQQSGLFPAFDNAGPDAGNLLQVPIHLGGGDVLQLLWELQGDETGGALYGNALVQSICKVHVPSGAGSVI